MSANLVIEVRRTYAYIIKYDIISHACRGPYGWRVCGVAGTTNFQLAYTPPTIDSIYEYNMPFNPTFKIQFSERQKGIEVQKN